MPIFSLSRYKTFIQKLSCSSQTTSAIHSFHYNRIHILPSIGLGQCHTLHIPPHFHLQDQDKHFVTFLQDEDHRLV